MERGGREGGLLSNTANDKKLSHFQFQRLAGYFLGTTTVCVGGMRAGIDVYYTPENPMSCKMPWCHPMHSAVTVDTLSRLKWV